MPSSIIWSILSFGITLSVKIVPKPTKAPSGNECVIYWTMNVKNAAKPTTHKVNLLHFFGSNDDIIKGLSS